MVPRCFASRCIALIPLALLFGTAISKECYDDGAEFCIFQEDILSVDLLPDSFLIDGQNLSATNSTPRVLAADGTIDVAFDSMGFHRKKMNEYLCHGFLAEQILTEVGSARVKRRLDHSGVDPILEYFGENNVTIYDKLLSDEGSSKYKDWLTKTTTLDDIYRRYAPRRKYSNNTRRRIDDRRYDDEPDDYYGTVTGFAVPAPALSGKIGGYHDSSGPGQVIDHYPGFSGEFHHADYQDTDFLPQFFEHHVYGPPTHHENYHHPHHQEYHHKPQYHHGKGKGHELSLKDFFEIALTALAFLAFGMFIIQLIMNVTNASTATAASLLQADIDGTRFRRDAPNFSPWAYSGNRELNELSQRVLRSIEAVVVADQDGGNCFRKTLCEDNRDSRGYRSARRIWIPVWSLGMSWLSGRMLWESRWSETLGSVKAAVLGLGGADCDALFPGCDLKHEVTKRRRRRRRRR